MKKNLFMKAAAVLTMIALAVAITVTPGTALATVTGVTITPDAGEPYALAVGGVVHLNAGTVGDVVGTMNYTWNLPGGGTNVSLSDLTGPTTTVTGLKPGTSSVVRLTGYDDAAPGSSFTKEVTITVSTMTISNTTLALNGGATQTLTVSNISAGSTTTWESDNTNVATVDIATGQVSAIGGGTAKITATNTPSDGDVQTKSCTVTVSPIITIDPASQNITTTTTSGSILLRVQYGGDLITSASTVAWTNSNSTAGTLTSKPTTFTADGSDWICTAVFTSNSTGVNASTNVKATISGTGTYTTSKTAVVNVRTERYLTVEGDTSLSNTDRYGDYTLTLREPDGSVVDDDTSTAHWSWSSSYLSLSSASLNDDRADMVDGEAKIQLYARYNTTSSGTRLYAWINDASSDRVYTTITITGLSSLPQTGQDMTLIYILGGSAILLFVAAGVWYGIRKKQTAA